MESLQVIEPYLAVLSDSLESLVLPAWVPAPVLPGWALGGIAYNETALTTSWIGPSPFDDANPAEVLFVSELPGSAVGSELAGRHRSYLGNDVWVGTPRARFVVEGRHTPLWWVGDAKPDRAAYVGEVGGQWLWVIVHPAEAGVLTAEPMELVDARRLGADLAALPVGATSLRLQLE